MNNSVRYFSAILVIILSFAVLKAPVPVSTGTDYVSFWSGELRIFAQQPDTEVLLVDIETGSPINLVTDTRVSSPNVKINGVVDTSNPFLLSAVGDQWVGRGGLGGPNVEIRVRILTSDATASGNEKPVTVWTGSQLGNNAWGSLIPSSLTAGLSFGSEVGQEFIGFVHNELVIVAPTDPSATTTVTVDNLTTTTNLTFDASISLCSGSFPPSPPATCYMVDDPEVQVVYQNGLSESRVIIDSNVDVSVLTGRRLFQGNDWSYSPPSFAAGDEGAELGTLFYFVARDSFTIFPTQDNTNVQITDLSDGDDSLSVSLADGAPGGAALDIYSVRTNGMLFRAASPTVTVTDNGGNLIDSDAIKITSDKPIIVYVGPPRSNTAEMADVAFSAYFISMKT